MLPALRLRPPSTTRSTRSSRAGSTPPEATTGISTGRRPPRQAQVEPLRVSLGPSRSTNLTFAVPCALDCPCDGVSAGRMAAPVCDYLPAPLSRPRASIAATAHSPPNSSAISHTDSGRSRPGVFATVLSAPARKRRRHLCRPDSSANGQRDEDLFCGAGHRLDDVSPPSEDAVISGNVAWCAPSAS